MTARNPSRSKWLTTFVPHRLEMLRSPAWLSAPPQLHRMLDRIEVEHLSHGGNENGNLLIPYLQFEQCGISRRQIRALCDLGEALGLIEVFKLSERGDGRVRPPNAYRLTYVPAAGKRAPTDEWRAVSPERACSLIAEFRDAEGKSRQRQDAASEPIEGVA